MSSPKDSSSKSNKKPPLRPKGVREADDERTGFIQYGDQEKDPLVELFDTIQTVREKNEQFKEKSNSPSGQIYPDSEQGFLDPLFGESSSLKKSPLWFKVSSSVIALFTVAAFSWIQFFATPEKPSSPQEQVTSVTEPKASKEKAKKPARQTPPSRAISSPPPQQQPKASPPPQQRSPFAPPPSVGTPQRGQGVSERIREQTRRSPPARQRAGSFFPTEDPGDPYDDDYYEDEEDDYYYRDFASEDEKDYYEEYYKDDRYDDDYGHDFHERDDPRARSPRERREPRDRDPSDERSPRRPRSLQSPFY